MNADYCYYCAGCGQPAGDCAVCGRAGRLHEHVSGEWYCQACLTVALRSVLLPVFSEPAPQHVEVYDSKPRRGGR